jgi:hypothetical protein
MRLHTGTTINNMGNRLFKTKTYQVQESTYKNCDLLKEVNYSPIYTPREDNQSETVKTIPIDIPTEYFKPKE